MEVISIERSTYEVIDFVASLVEELWCQFQHRHVSPAVMRLDKLSHIFS